MLRLTLRTLLAYLDDTLEPAEARDIGQRIKDNEQTQELIERCKVVMRRRRLKAPSPDPDETTLDPNIVAAYLDNTLSPEKVAKAEKQFLRSDTDLAEVACVHQILSMVLGRPANISLESRNRIYALVGGKPEKPVQARPIGPTPSPVGVRPVDPHLIDSQPLPLAIPAYGPGTGKGTWATVLVVIVLTMALGGVIWQVVSPSGNESADLTSAVSLAPKIRESEPESEQEPAKATTETAPGPQGEQGPVAPQEPVPPADEQPTASPAEPSDEKPAEPSTPKLPQAILPPSPPSTITPMETPKAEADDEVETKVTKQMPVDIDATVPIGSYQSGGSVLLKQTGENRQRLKPNSFVFAGEMLINFEGFRSQVKLATESVMELVDLTRLELLPSGPNVLSLDLHRGKVVIKGDSKPLTVNVSFADRTLELEIDGDNSLLGMEMILTSLDAPKELFRLQVTRGEVRVGGDPQQSVPAGNELFLHPNDPNLTIRPIESAWSWITEVPDAAARRSADNLARILPYGEGLETEFEVLLREQLSARTREVRRLSVRGLAALHAFGSLIDAMAYPDDSEVRVIAIESIREAIYFQPQVVAQLRESLYLLYDQQDTESILQMLVGYSPDELAREETYERLVDQLQNERLIMRELAIYNLKTLTGRDMGYAADATSMRRNTPVSQWRRWLAELDERSLPLKGR